MSLSLVTLKKKKNGARNDFCLLQVWKALVQTAKLEVLLHHMSSFTNYLLLEKVRERLV